MNFTWWRNGLIRLRMWWTAHGERLKMLATLACALVVAAVCLAGLAQEPEHDCGFALMDSCPTFSEIGTRSVLVLWLPPSKAYLVRRYELHVIETYSTDPEELTQVYSGLKRSVELHDLTPATSYNFTVVIIGHRDSIRSSCSRYMTTMGEGNLLANPSFEQLGGPLIPHIDYEEQRFAAYWEPMMMPYSVKQLPKKAGRSWFTHSNDQPNKQAANQWVLLNQTEPMPLLFSAWSKAEAVSGEPDDGYSVIMDLKYQDGTYSYAITLNFDTGTHDWQRKCTIVYVDKPVWSASVSIVFSEHTGSAWVDDVYLTADFAESLEDQCARLQNLSTIKQGCCTHRESILATETPSHDDVAIATQMTIDRLSILESMTESWGGPISAAILMVEPEIEIKQIYGLRNRSSIVRKYVDFHLVYSHENFYALRTLGLYPVNTLRNEALVKARTAHLMALDIDFIPSRNARRDILRLWDRLHEAKTVFVVPSFEMDDFNVQEVPHNKRQLIKMVNEERIRQVHRDKWFPAHGPTDYERWYTTNQVYKVEYKRDYEPYYIVRQDIPKWDERFVGYGFDKVAHARELAEAGYSFYVLPDVFIIHAEHGVPRWRDKGDLVRVRVWLNLYAFLGEMLLRHKTQLDEHSHVYEGKDWAAEEGFAVMAGPVYATGLMASFVVFAIVATTHLARARKMGRFF